MEFEIVVHNPKSEYAPGDRIEGRVVLNSKTNVDTGSIRIDFIGKSKANLHMDQRQRYQSKAILFQYAKALYTGNTTFHAGCKFEWPFAFTFPRTPQRPIEDTRFKKDGCWIYDSDWPLPPSMFCYDISMRGKLKCDVQYQLKAELTKPEFTFRTRLFHCKKELTLSPIRDLNKPSSSMATQRKIWEFQTLRVLPQFQCRSLTAKEKIHSIFSWNVPLSSFEITTSLPHRVVRGARIPVCVQVNHLPQHSTAEATPEIHLRELSLSTTMWTHGRAKGELFWYDMEMKEKQRFFQRKDLNVTLHDGNCTGLEPKPMDLGELFDIKCDAPMDFQSYNVRRNHTLKLRIVIQCADKRQELQHVLPGFLILPHLYSNASSPALVAAPDVRCKFLSFLSMAILV